MLKEDLYPMAAAVSALQAEPGLSVREAARRMSDSAELARQLEMLVAPGGQVRSRAEVEAQLPELKLHRQELAELLAQLQPVVPKRMRRVLVPGAIDHNLVRHASRRHYGKLFEAGVEIHEYRAALLHAKTLVIDGVWATVGSTNLDNRSFALNDELNVIIYDRNIARRLEAIFEADVAHAERLEYRKWRARGLFDRLLELMSLPINDTL